MDLLAVLLERSAGLLVHRKGSDLAQAVVEEARHHHHQMGFLPCLVAEGELQSQAEKEERRIQVAEGEHHNQVEGAEHRILAAAGEEEDLHTVEEEEDLRTAAAAES